MKKIFLIISVAVLLGAGCSERPPSSMEEIKKIQVTEPVTFAAPAAADPNDIYKKSEPSVRPRPASVKPMPGALPPNQLDGKHARIKTDRGDIVIALLGREAPLAASNFIWLAVQGFYNGLAFHRLEPGFVIQGGDPRGDGTGGPGYTFKDEPVRLPYRAGTVAMANSGPDTNGSQFFIVLADQPRLPPRYTIFGTVTDGMEVVQMMTRGDRMISVTIE